MIKNFEIADDGNDNPELNRNPKILNQTRLLKSFTKVIYKKVSIIHGNAVLDFCE